MHRRRYGDLNDEERQLRTNKIGDLDTISTFSPYSPARNLESIQAPIQIYHGTNDESVPYQRSVDTL